MVAGSWRRELPSPPAKPAGEGDHEVPHRGRGLVQNLARLDHQRREPEVDGGREQAERHLHQQALERSAKDLAVRGRHPVRDGQDRVHERADEHGAHDRLGRVGVEPDAGDEHGHHQDAQVGAVQSGAVHKATAYDQVRGTSLTDVEEVPQAAPQRRERMGDGAHPPSHAAVCPARTLRHAVPPQVGRGTLSPGLRCDALGRDPLTRPCSPTRGGETDPAASAVGIAGGADRSHDSAHPRGRHAHPHAGGRALALPQIDCQRPATWPPARLCQTSPGQSGSR